MEKLTKNPESIESERLIIRPIQTIYASEIYYIFARDKNLTEHMAFSAPKSLNEEIEFIRMAMAKNAKGTDFFVSVFKKDSDELIGGSGLHKLDTKTPELGIWIKKSCHGHKYGLETVAALVDWARQNLDFDYLSYPVVDANIPSRKIPEALGGKVARHYVDQDDQGKDMSLVEYRIYK